MTNCFSFKRFWAYASAYYSQDVRGNVLKVAGFAVFTVLMYLLFRNIWLVQEVSWLESASNVCAFTAFWIWVYTISMSFRFYFKPSTASFQFMLPASRSEKFTLAFVSNMIVVPLILGLILLLNDYVWAEIAGQPGFFEEFFDKQIMGPHSWDGEKYVYESIFQLKYFWHFYFAFIMLCLLVSVFFLGSVIFRRYQFLYTLIFFFVFGFSWFLFEKSGITVDIPVTRVCAGELVPVQMSLLEWLFEDYLAAFSLFLTAIFGGIIYLAWCRFSRIQITK